MQKGQIYLIPTPLSDSFTVDTISKENLEIISKLESFVVEELRTARRFLSKIGLNETLHKATFNVLNEHTDISEIESLLSPALNGQNIGLMSEAGMPSVADPGHALVKAAHRKDITIVPLYGASSMILALAASGLNGQQFTFHGYFPLDKIKKKTFIEKVLKQIQYQRYAQIFIETPYRNLSLFQFLLETCPNTLQLCIAVDVTGENQYIKTKSIADWKKIKFDFPKLPTVFILGT